MVFDHIGLKPKAVPNGQNKTNPDNDQG